VKREVVFLCHILDEIAFLEEHCSAIAYDDLIHDEVLKRSVLLSIEVIGEAESTRSCCGDERVS